MAIPVRIIIIVVHLIKGILLPILSDQAPQNGEVNRRRMVDKVNVMPYQISSNLLSKTIHWAKNMPPMAEVKGVLAKSYKPQRNIFFFESF